MIVENEVELPPGWILSKNININPLWTIGHICHTIFGPRRRCAYLKIALERLKIWKNCAAIFCSSWNCASNEPNYKSIAIVVPKLHAVKVLRRLSEKTRKSQNLIVFKGLNSCMMYNFFVFVCVTVSWGGEYFHTNFVMSELLWVLSQIKQPRIFTLE